MLLDERKQTPSSLATPHASCHEGGLNVSIKHLLFIFGMLVLSSHPLLFAQDAAPQESPAADKAQTKDEQLRQIQINAAKLAMILAEKLMEKSRKELENLQKMLKEANNIVTVQEVNRAEEEFERARAAYEDAKLNLQKIEINSLKDAWHITILNTRRYEAKDGREMFSITLKNSSLPVKLEQSSLVVGKDVIISAQIDDIFVSIKDQNGAIIAQPYEVRIPSLKEGESKPLEFELVKEEVQDVVVSLKYLDVEENRNIHLKQEEPYISVLSARRYKEKDRRRLELVLKYGATTGSETPPPTPSGGESSTSQEINNVYVSLQDENGAIIGVPYEIRIPTLKFHQEQKLDFELRKNVQSVVVSLRYLEKEYRRNIHLEEDTRHISILSAKKYRVGNQIKVTIGLKNASTAESMPASATLEEIAAANEIRSIYVSLKEADGTNIAQPYEQKIPLLAYNAQTELTFNLQKDVESVMVALKYLDVGEDNRLVYLQKESAEDMVNVSSLRFSQEGNLGSSVTYDLILDRLAETEKTFQLRVINLLDRLSFEFRAVAAAAEGGGGGSRLSQVKFTQAQSKQALSLIVYLPEELDASYLDQNLPFYVAVIDEEEAVRLGGVNNRLELSPEQIAQIKGGVERFELIPKGVPEIELFIPNAYHTIKIGEQVPMTLKLKNIGTRDLVDIRMVIDVYTDWKYTVEPEVVASLKRNEEREIRLTLIPSANVGVGEYETKVNAEVTVDNRRFESGEKTVRVHIESKTKLSVTTLLFGALILLVIGIAVLTVRISRR
jgi:hypothetical protein